MQTPFETVEFNPDKQLLIIRNPKLDSADEIKILSKSGWEQVDPSEYLSLLPPTPGPTDTDGLFPLGRKTADQLRGTASNDQTGDGAPAQGTRKRVYRPSISAAETNLTVRHV